MGQCRLKTPLCNESPNANPSGELLRRSLPFVRLLRLSALTWTELVDENGDPIDLDLSQLQGLQDLGGLAVPKEFLDSVVKVRKPNEV